MHCYRGDDRKMIHALAFADLVRKSCDRFESYEVKEYIVQAKNWLDIELKRGKMGKKSRREINQAIVALEGLLN